MKRLLVYSAIIFCVITACSVQKPVQKSEEAPLFTIGDQRVSKDEFKYAFLKNYKPSDSISLETEVKDYLDLYVKFKLKVREARERDYHTRAKYINELNSYQKELAQPYLTANKVTDELIQEAYDRMKQEVKASHILISVQSDTAAAKKKILEVKALAEQGLDFDSLASVYSTDPSAKNNGGNLGYFSSMQMVYPFETAAYNTSIGNISEVVTTRFGYHILKVFDKRASQGKVRVAHIMLRSNQSTTPEDDKKLEDKINAIYKEASEGKDWNQLAKDFSQDARSKNSGGELPWISTGNFVPDFEKVAFSLEEKDELSQPFKTIYGWHIVKLLEKKGVGTLEEVKPEISSRIQRDSRSQIKNQQVISRLQKENNYVRFDEAINSALTALDKNDTTSIDKTQTLFSLQEKKYTIQDFLTYLVENGTASKNNKAKYNQFEEKSILNFEGDQLEVKYPDYANLLNEYRDGILLFDIMEEEVWKKASRDTVGLKSYYEDNKESYTKYQVKKAIIYSTKDQNVISQVSGLIGKGVSNEEIMNTINEDAPLLLQSSEGLFEKGENSLVDQAEDDSLFEIADNGKFYLIQVVKRIEQVIPKMKNIRGKLISDYQDQLEKNWIAQLNTKYAVNTYEKSLKEVIDEIKNK